MSTVPSSAVAESRFVRGIAASLSDGEPGIPQLHSAAESVRDDPRAFVSWLAGLSRDAGAVRAVVARSYWHPNGFAKLILHTSAEPAFRIRLHVWPEATGEKTRGESNPHSHRWEFASVVLVGEGMHMVEYQEVTDRGKLFTRYRYGTDPADPAALVADGAARLFKTRSPHVFRAEVYSCDTDVVHTVEPIGRGLTATVVVQGPHRTPDTVVYCAPGESDDQPNHPLSESDFHLLVKSVVTEVGG